MNVFCGFRCAGTFGNKNRRKPEIKKICEGCGIEFSITDNKKGKVRKYCGRPCADKCRQTPEVRRKKSKKVKEKFKEISWKQRKSKRICQICGIEFLAYPRKRWCQECEYETRKCKLCGKEFKVKRERLKNFCSGNCKGLYSNIGRMRRSKNEIYFADLCKENFKNVLTNEPIFNGWDADVILPDHKIAVSWNGVWHYKKIGTHSLKQARYKDKLRDVEIRNKKYNHYIIKDLGGENKEFVEKEFEKFMRHLKCGGVV